MGVSLASAFFLVDTTSRYRLLVQLPGGPEQSADKGQNNPSRLKSSTDQIYSHAKAKRLLL